MFTSRISAILLLLLLAACGRTSAAQPPANPANATNSPLPAIATETLTASPEPNAAPSATPEPAPAPSLTLTPSPSPIAPPSASPDVPTVTLTASAAPEITPAPAPCGYAWGYQDAPGVPERARQALEAAGLAPTNVSAHVYGENCVNADGSVREFLAMGTTVTAELPVADLDDLDALGALVAQVSGALETIGSTPGPEPEARLIFTAGGDTRAIQFTLRNARVQLDAGHTGAALLSMLGYQP